MRQLKSWMKAMLIEQLEARGFGPRHISNNTSKELKAVRLVILSFLPLLRGRKVLMHEGNKAVVVAISHLTTRSTAMEIEF
jgi:hypothetical protein